jgi:release factor glutamine methyltransferase
MVVQEILHKTTAFFKEKGLDSPRLDAELLIAHALRWERIQLYLKFDYPMAEAEVSACRESVRRRARGEPVAYIVGEREFYHSSFAVEPGVLVPRPETEGVVEAALAFAAAKGLGQEATRPFRAIDFGCGSGCIGLSIAKELPAARVLCVDSSETAARVAAANAERLGVGARAEARLIAVESLGRGDVEAALGGPVDAVVANPPYVEEGDPRLEKNVREHEPALALFSGEGGLRHVRVWAAKAAEIAPAGALAIFEIGSGQGEAARALFASAGAFCDIEILFDLAGHERFVRAVRAGDSDG